MTDFHKVRKFGDCKGDNARIVQLGSFDWKRAETKVRPVDFTF